MILSDLNYDIIIENGISKQFNAIISKYFKGKKIFIITDSNLYKLYKIELLKSLSDFDIDFIILKPNEKSKSFRVYENTVNNLLKKNIRKDDLIISFGGGVVSDISGFVASTILRGVDLVLIPTSLLAMVDASIGSKNAINTKYSKNLVGTFYDPLLVLIDPEYLNTLAKDEYENGLAEVIKVGLIKDKSIVDYLRGHEKINIEYLIKAIKVKYNIIMTDPYEKNERLLLNFGHTFGHAIERFYKYRKYKHGEAIAYGMLIAIAYGIKLGITKDELYDEAKKLLMKFNLVKEPILDSKVFIPLIRFDKKNKRDHLNFICLRDYESTEIIAIKDFDL